MRCAARSSSTTFRASALGYQYLAVTDHTQHVRVAGGLDAAGFRAQMRRIDALNARLTRLVVLKGAEVDILADGSLDLDANTLAALDIVLVSLHSRLDLDPAAQTARVIRALRHPSVDVFSPRLVNRYADALEQMVREGLAEGAKVVVALPEAAQLIDARAGGALARLRFPVPDARRTGVRRSSEQAVAMAPA